MGKDNETLLVPKGEVGCSGPTEVKTGQPNYEEYRGTKWKIPTKDVRPAPRYFVEQDYSSGEDPNNVEGLIQLYNTLKSVRALCTNPTGCNRSCNVQRYITVLNNYLGFNS